MDLWIRNQDRNLLLKVDNINCCGTKIYTNNHDAAMSIDLGEYDTKERALEVLGEIQKLLIGDVLAFKNFDAPNDDYFKSAGIDNAIVYHSFTDDAQQVDFLHRDCVVYEMPEE